jgi:predicted RNA-binding protein with PUA-like domain
MQYWLMKNEPEELSVQMLEAMPGKRGFWDGVRSYQARRIIRDDMAIGDRFLYYHSSCKPPGVAGLGVIDSDAEVDPSQFDSENHYYDPRSKPEDPRWLGRWVKHERTFKRFIPLQELREHTDRLGGSDFALLRKANRLSVMPVTKDQFDFIVNLERRPA